MASANQLDQGASGSGTNTSTNNNPPIPTNNNEDSTHLPTNGLAKIPPFADTKDISARAFIDLLQSIAATYKWEAVQTTNAAISAFKGEARAWYEATKYRDAQVFETYDNFEAAFLERFKGTQNSAQQVRTFSTLYQRPDESVTAFLDRVDNALIAISRDAMPKAQQKKAGAAHMMGHFAIIIFLNGLLPSIKADVEAQFKVNDSLDYNVKRETLLDVAQRWEASHRDNRAAAPVQVTSPAPVAAFQSRGSPRTRGRPYPRGAPRMRFARSLTFNGTPQYSNGVPPSATPARPVQTTPPHIIAARRRWVKCLKCMRWGKHYARECPYPASNVTAVTSDQPPTDPIHDEYFDKPQHPAASAPTN